MQAQMWNPNVSMHNIGHTTWHHYKEMQATIIFGDYLGGRLEPQHSTELWDLVLDCKFSGSDSEMEMTENRLAAQG